MNRFFVNPEEIVNNVVDIGGEDAIHILRVLRLREGSFIEVCDGAGNDYKGTILKKSKDRVQVLLEDPLPNENEPNIKVTLYQGIPKGSKMDFIIQKCVELGVYSVVPVVTARTIIDLSGPGKEIKKVARWQKIAEEAAKQSGRGIIPKVELPLSFDEVIKEVSDPLKILPWEEESRIGLKAVLQEKTAQDTALLIGSEGGFEKEEVERAKERGWNVVTLGPRILRTETAGMAVLSAIMFHMEEME